MAGNIFPSDAAAEVFALVILVWVLSEFIGAGIIPAMRRRGARVRRRNVASNLLVYIEWIVVFLVSLNFPPRKIAMLPGWVYYIGIVVMVAGIVIRQSAIAVLGRFFSTNIGVQYEHRVVDTGPYRLVRHPSYSGAFVLQLGIGLAVQNWGALLVIIAGFAIVYGQRMLAEEKVLVSALGEDYVRYMKRTKRIIPYVV